MPAKRSNLVKPLIQVAFISLGVLCALSRIFDYWHHWGDVMVGLCLGTIVAFFIVSFISLYSTTYHELCYLKALRFILFIFQALCFPWCYFTESFNYNVTIRQYVYHTKLIHSCQSSFIPVLTYNYLVLFVRHSDH